MLLVEAAVAINGTDKFELLYTTLVLTFRKKTGIVL